MRIVLTKFARFARHQGFVQAWAIPVWCLLGLAKIAIFTVSYRRLQPFLGTSVGVVPWVPVLSEVAEERARQVGAVVRLVSRYTLWESNCFPQAIVSRLLLGLYGIDYCLFFGVRRGNGPDSFDAHAWIAAGHVRVIGGWSFHEYTVVGVIASPALAADVMPDSRR